MFNQTEIITITDPATPNLVPFIFLGISLTLCALLIHKRIRLKRKEEKIRAIIQKIEEGREAKVFYFTRHRLPREGELKKTLPETEKQKERLSLLKGVRL